eukprot:Sspe_Gene.86009::Locus_56742_Transcript_1_1_Confidence_1.000_Length_711::g.86009::m.86009
MSIKGSEAGIRSIRSFEDDEAEELEEVKSPKDLFKRLVQCISVLACSIGFGLLAVHLRGGRDDNPPPFACAVELNQVTIGGWHVAVHSSGSGAGPPIITFTSSQNDSQVAGLLAVQAESATPCWADPSTADALLPGKFAALKEGREEEAAVASLDLSQCGAGVVSLHETGLLKIDCETAKTGSYLLGMKVPDTEYTFMQCVFHVSPELGKAQGLSFLAYNG